MRIVATSNSVSVRATGGTTGDIWLVMDDRCFPSDGWNDFVVVVLIWWTGAILDLMRKNRRKVRVYFMEGPYLVELEGLPSERLRVRALEHRAKGRFVEVSSGETGLYVFAADLAAQTRGVIRECRRQGSWSRDDVSLDDALSALEKEISRRE